MMNATTPNYKLIYSDIINTKYPDKKDECEVFLSKPSLSVLDVIEINNKIFGMNCRATEMFSQKHRSYNKKTILEILDYQKKNNLNNVQLAIHFKLSRNTVAKWKALFYCV